jgi:predicted transcriptional regulator
MKESPRHGQLGRRERQIMEAVYRLGRATVADVLEQIDDPPSYSAVRAMLRILESKGHLRHEQDGPRYVYLPVVPSAQARGSILRDMVHRLFGGSTEDAVAALLDRRSARLGEAELDRLERMIRSARKQGR